MTHEVRAVIYWGVSGHTLGTTIVNDIPRYTKNSLKNTKND